jgi:hypothetical protein
VCGLAYTAIRADRAGQARFVVGSDDQLAIVLNRRTVYLASASVEIGRDFAGTVRRLEDLTATLDGRVQEVTRQLEKKLLAQARLETLRYQLNPHFLYNALNAVEALSREGPAQIPEVVQRLCECLRYALHPKKGGIATLRQELQEVASYLQVEHCASETAWWWRRTSPMPLNRPSSRSSCCSRWSRTPSSTGCGPAPSRSAW